MTRLRASGREYSTLISPRPNACFQLCVGLAAGTLRAWALRSEAENNKAAVRELRRNFMEYGFWMVERRKWRDETERERKRKRTRTSEELKSLSALFHRSVSYQPSPSRRLPSPPSTLP